MNVIGDGPDQFAKRAAPIVLPRPAMEIAAAIVNPGFNFVGIAYAVKGDVEKEITKPAAQLEGSFE
jgi:hypothetical protein